MKRFLLVLFGIFICFNVIAEEVKEEQKEETAASNNIELPPIVVSPTKYESPLYSIPSSITVIDEEEIVLKSTFQVKDVLRNVPGVHIVETSSFGGSTSIFTRGTESSHTLVMIDGIKVFNPISTNGSFNLANLTLDNVERIEVLRGTHSTLYGSDAIGGVIDIITKKGSGKPKIWASFEGGSHVTFKESVGSDGEMNGLHYSAAFARLDTKGVSKADKKYDNDEKDAYHNTSISSRVDYDIFENFSIGSTFRYTDAEIKVDDSGGYGGDDPNRRNREKYMVLSTYANLGIFEWWKLEFKSLWLRYELFDKDKGDDIDPGEYLNSEFKGRNTSFEALSILELTEFDTLSCGIDYDGEEGDSFYDSYTPAWGGYLADSPRATAHNVGYYLQNKADVGDNFHSIAGFRIDDHSEFGTYDTYEISGKYTFDPSTVLSSILQGLVKSTACFGFAQHPSKHPEHVEGQDQSRASSDPQAGARRGIDWQTSVKGSWATGFKAPSLYQLYDPSNGNANLKPEESKSFEMGLGQELFDGRLKVESTYFYTKLENLIEWALVDPIWFTGQYRNVSKAKIYGVESVVSLEPIREIRINYAHTYLKTRNEMNDQNLNRRPMNKHSLSVDIFPLDNLSFNVSYLFVADRKDVRWVGATEEQIVLKHYNKVDFSGRYVINKNFEVFGRVENLLNEHYQEVDGYGMPGISFYGGGKITF